MNLETALQLATKKIKQAKIETADLDALILLVHVLKKPKEYILAHPEIKLTKTQEKHFFAAVEKRASRFPLAYIIGRKEFYGRDFLVNENVLIPRPETEKIIDLALEKILEQVQNDKGAEILRSAQNDKREKQNDKIISILDLGTGSGCIGITLAKELEKRGFNYKIIASDISNNTLKAAKENAKNLNAKKIRFIKSNLFQNIHGKFDLIVTNLPYVKKEEIKNELQFEPRLALLDQKQIPQMLKQAPKYLKPNGIVIYETTNGEAKKYFSTSLEE
jgi:release factor glutamine methyltransferase